WPRPPSGSAALAGSVGSRPYPTDPIGSAVAAQRHRQTATATASARQLAARKPKHRALAGHALRDQLAATLGILNGADPDLGEPELCQRFDGLHIAAVQDDLARTHAHRVGPIGP